MRSLIILYLNKPSSHLYLNKHKLDREQSSKERYMATKLNLNEHNYMTNSILGDLYVRLAQCWREQGFIDEAKLIAVRYPQGHARYTLQGEYDLGNNVKVFVLPNVYEYGKVHVANKTDIIFIRGGQSYWEPILDQYKESNFRLFYDGSSTSSRLPNYPLDVVLCDESKLRKTPNTRAVEFVKFCDENIFRPLNLEKRYDVCLIGTLTPKKAQLEFARIAEKSWRIAIVGDQTDKEYVQRIQEILPQAEFFGEVRKTRVNQILNQSKVSVIFSKKNDACPRIIVESLAAGTPVMIHRRNLGRKYVQPGAGLICGRFQFRRRLNRMIRNYDSYEPYKVYKRHFHSNKVASELWTELAIPKD
jgi:glycosyltransferase involved in cell wall biosynthesis